MKSEEDGEGQRKEKWTGKCGQRGNESEGTQKERRSEGVSEIKEEDAKRKGKREESAKYLLAFKD